MSYLIDTCVLSEWKRRRPAKAVVEWLASLKAQDIYLSILTIGELRKGIIRLPRSKKRSSLNAWLDELVRVYRPRIIPVSFAETAAWAEMTAKAENAGKPLSAVDGLIAATAGANGLTVATRNVRHMASSGVRILDPWTGRLHNG